MLGKGAGARNVDRFVAEKTERESTGTDVFSPVL